jgi:hypothetical protein
MAKELKANVYVDGVLYGPDGEKPDAEVSKRIVNEAAWKGVDDGAPAGPGAVPGDSSDEDSPVLEGAALDSALEQLGLSTSGSDETKRKRLGKAQADNG